MRNLKESWNLFVFLINFSSAQKVERIYNGKDSNGYVFLASIIEENNVISCGGSLISDDLVLTAAHCVITGKIAKNTGSADSSFFNLDIQQTPLWDVSRNRSYPVAFGLSSSKTLENALVRFVSDAYCHSDYAPLSDTFRNDICLLRLSTPILPEDVSSLIQVKHVCSSKEKCQKNLCLPRSAQEEPPSECVVAGFGYTEEYINSNPPQLQETVVKYYSHETCSKWHKDFNLFEGEHFCYGMKDGSSDNCEGDSGGPLICPSSKEGTLVQVGGIVSFGKRGICERSPEENKKSPGVYTNVAKYLSWIQSIEPEIDLSCASERNYYALSSSAFSISFQIIANQSFFILMLLLVFLE
ncbi:Oidioi.mRNA.OKI2018_I69.chr2.g6235.t1.cds [Oikopleura dioica]|uniref:Oidioi.mRNA.OKI2018_I69.chr2.g6235.t1.cds n=1 Tax=Oikopleura dioica TaxID=34765 RepID=A0ABN7T8U7_OIKDI|nr:Oidioi.mRNA.OKI2018_I69.chr2.g6235.t1.cds [Oikopleura dioica]